MTSRRPGQRDAVRNAVVVLLLLTVLLGLTNQSAAAGRADGQGSLRILYAGHPGSEREADFVQFLNRQFGAIETTDLAAFRESQCDGFDVTILDYDGNGLNAPRATLSRQFSRPVITMGVAGALMGAEWGLKTGYL